MAFKPKFISFDCYGTLIDWEFGITETVSGLAAAHGVHPTEIEILSQFASHETHVQDANPTWTYPVILAETWRRMATSMGLPDSLTHPAQCERDAQAFASSVPNWPAFDDSHEALLDLQRQCKLVILSNDPLNDRHFQFLYASPADLMQKLEVPYN